MRLWTLGVGGAQTLPWHTSWQGEIPGVGGRQLGFCMISPSKTGISPMNHGYGFVETLGYSPKISWLSFILFLWINAAIPGTTRGGSASANLPCLFASTSCMCRWNKDPQYSPLVPSAATWLATCISRCCLGARINHPFLQWRHFHRDSSLKI